MLIKFEESGLKLVFALDDEKRLYLIYIGDGEPDENIEPKVPFYATEIKLTGHSRREQIGARNCCHLSDGILKYVSHTEKATEKGREIVFFLEDNAIETQLHYLLFKGIKAVSSYTVITNKTDMPVGVEYVSSFCMAGFSYGAENGRIDVMYARNCWCRELLWERASLDRLDCAMSKSTSRIALSNTGSWSTKEYLPVGIMTDKENGSTMMWQIESNSSWCWEVGAMNGERYLRLSGPCEQENGWWINLPPKGSFESVKAAVTVSESFDGAIAEMTRYRRAIASRPKSDSSLPVVFNDYMGCLVANPTTEKLLPIIERAAEAGAEIFCMDAGWYADGGWWSTVGEWEAVGWRFPNGIKEVFDKIKACGMTGGIWLEPEVMGIACGLAEEMDDSCFFMRHGIRAQNRERYQLDFRNPKVVEHMTAIVDRLVRELDIGYFKFDYNIDIGVGTEVDADSFGEGLLKACRAFIEWVDSLHKKYPDLIIENCGSGGMRMDYMSLAHFEIQSLTDAETLLPITAVSNASQTAVIPEQAGVWVVPRIDDSIETVESYMVNGLLRRPVLSGQIAELDSERFERIKSGVALYKELRCEIPNLIPFYPWGIQGYGEDVYCSGFYSDECVYIILQNMTDGERKATVKLGDFKSVMTASEIYPDTRVIEVINRELNITLSRNSAKLIKIV